MRNGIFIIGIVFAATLAYVVGNRLSNEAMAVLVGALCGISASIPVSIALFIAASKNWGRIELSRPEPSEPPRTYAPPRPFVMIAPAQSFQAPNPFGTNQFYLPPNAPIEGAPREFKIIGEE